MNTCKKIILVSLLLTAFASVGTAQKKNAKIDVGEALKGYFKPVATPSAAPDQNGFIRRWMILEPISKPNPTNRVFTDSYTRENLSVEYFPNQFTVLPKDGDKLKVTMEYQPPVNLSSNRPSAPQPEQPKFVKATLTWRPFLREVVPLRYRTGQRPLWSHFLDCNSYKLRPGHPECQAFNRFQQGSQVVGNGEEVLLLAGYRHMCVDSAVSDRITLKKGKNILRGVTMNGPGMSEFCARFIDDYGKPVTNYTITCN